MLYQLNYCPALILLQHLALFMNSMFPAEGAEFLQLHSVRMLTLVPGGGVIPVLAIFTSQNDDISHFLSRYAGFIR